MEIRPGLEPVNPSGTARQQSVSQPQPRRHPLAELVADLRILVAELERVSELACAALGLNRSELTVLVLVGSRQQVTMAELRQHLHLRPSRASGLVARLEEAGLAQRLIDREDRRRTVVAPSLEVREFVRQGLERLASELALAPSEAPRALRQVALFLRSLHSPPDP